MKQPASSEGEWESTQIRAAIWLCLYFCFSDLAPPRKLYYICTQWKICIYLHCCHIRLMAIYLPLFMSSEYRHPSASCCQYHHFQSSCWVLVIFMNHPPCCQRCSLKQAHREHMLIWKPGSFCKRALYFNCIHFKWNQSDSVPEPSPHFLTQ